ncbi:MAG TPA: hypothetical protein VG943_14125 [Caulobacterales bacterium]|nr:hypothetical protein [Caulobacterales bacterium]
MADDRTFEFYRLMVEEAREARAARRDLANVFMTLNLAGVGALGFLAKDGGEARLNPALLIWCAVALVFVCFIWRASNAYYTQIITAKFDVINALENQLGMRPLQDEWSALAKRRAVRFFTLERAMPVLFIVGYVVFLAYQVSWDEAIDIAQSAWAPLARLIGSVHH